MKTIYTPLATAKAMVEADETLLMLMEVIVAANKAKEPDRVAYKAFADRLEEIGVIVRPGYLSVMRDAVLRVVRDRNKVS